MFTNVGAYEGVHRNIMMHLNEERLRMTGLAKREIQLNAGTDPEHMKAVEARSQKYRDLATLIDRIGDGFDEILESVKRDRAMIEEGDRDDHVASSGQQ